MKAHRQPVGGRRNLKRDGKLNRALLALKLSCQDLRHVSDLAVFRRSSMHVHRPVEMLKLRNARREIPLPTQSKPLALLRLLRDTKTIPAPPPFTPPPRGANPGPKLWPFLSFCHSCVAQ